MSATAIASPEAYRFDADGAFPNSALPVLVYRGAVPRDADAVEEVLARNGWAPAWRVATGFYPFHHVHGTAHEFVALVAGEVRGRVGGPSGADVTLRAGDAVVIPAGVAHFGAYASPDSVAIGAYPVNGPGPDMHRGERAEFAAVRAAAARVPHPGADPLFGPSGPLTRAWASPRRA
jgi:uncharacterized protein YjlB